MKGARTCWTYQPKKWYNSHTISHSYGAKTIQGHDLPGVQQADDSMISLELWLSLDPFGDVSYFTNDLPIHTSGSASEPFTDLRPLFGLSSGSWTLQLPSHTLTPEALAPSLSNHWSGFLSFQTLSAHCWNLWNATAASLTYITFTAHTQPYIYMLLCGVWKES